MIDPAERLVRPVVMDRPVLYSLVERVRAEERLQEFAEALPTRARVSEPVLPLRASPRSTTRSAAGSIVALAEDADARDVAEAAGWFLGDESVALFPSRGVRWESGLEPPPHLIGERARALDVFERGGLVCVSAAALAEGMPPVAARPTALRIAQGDEPGIDGLAAELADAGYDGSSASRSAASSRCAAASSTSTRRPAASRSGSSCSATRSSRSAPSRRSRSARCGRSRRRRSIRPPSGEASSSRSTLPDDDEPIRVPDDLVAPFDRPPDLVWSPDDVRAVWDEEWLAPVSLEGATELSPLPQGQPFSFDAQRPALAARGLSEAENELNGLLRQELDIVVAFPHRGEALRQQALLRRSQAHVLEPGEAPDGLAFAVVARAPRLRLARARPRAAARHAGLPEAPARARRPRPGARCRASPTCAPATTSCTRTTASRS